MSERSCCDGLCVKGHACPAFAPGVIEHHRLPMLQRVRRGLRALWAWLGEDSTW